MNLKNRPYLEVEVVKKEKKFVCPDSGRAICFTCGEKLYHIEKPKRREGRNKLVYDKKSKTIVNVSKGNWVNEENLDKIKFPVPCSYIDNEDGKKHIGMLNCYVNWYRLYNIEEQSKDNFIDDCTSLGNLIRDYDIHILKGKIIVFE